MNYAHAAVREHQMAFVRELLERYDPDGLELDWMRFGYHLTPGHEREEAEILTDFVREVRSLTTEWSKKRGHAIRLAVRAPAHPDAAAGLGMDAVLWAREGLVDMIVPCPFWTSSDFDIPVELWRERLGEAAERVTVAPGVEYNARPWPGGAAVANDLASLRGFAASAYDRGAESIYLFNWMDSETRPVTESDYARLLREGLSRQAVTTAAPQASGVLSGHGAARASPTASSCPPTRGPGRASAFTWDRNPRRGRSGRFLAWPSATAFRRRASRRRSTAGPWRRPRTWRTSSSSAAARSVPCGSPARWTPSRTATTRSASARPTKGPHNRSCGSRCAWIPNRPA